MRGDAGIGYSCLRSATIRISASQEGSEYRGLYSVRCQSSFRCRSGRVKLQGLAVRHSWCRRNPGRSNCRAGVRYSASFDSAGKAPKGAGWERAVPFRTVPSAQSPRRGRASSEGRRRQVASHLGLTPLPSWRAAATWPRSARGDRSARTRHAGHRDRSPDRAHWQRGWNLAG